MDKIEPKKVENREEEGMINFILSHSYFIFFLAVILGALLDPLIDKEIFSNLLYTHSGFVMLIVGSLLVYWAQKTSLTYKQRVSKDDTGSFFEFGPYKYMRNPTHLGLFILTLGFSLMINSLFGVILNIIAYIITRVYFLKKEEELLEDKHGQVYADYKKKVKNWL